MKKLIVFLEILLCSNFIYSKSYSKFCFHEKYGLIDEKQNLFIKPEYDGICFYDELCIVCKINNTCTKIYDKNLNLVHFFDNEKDMIRKFSDSEVLIGKKLLLNVYTGEIYQRKDKYQNEYGYNNEVQVVLVYNEQNKPSHTFFVMNKNRKIISQSCLQSGDQYSQSMLPVILQSGKSGYLNSKGHLSIEVPIYDDPRTAALRISPNLNYPFHDGVAFLQTEKDVWVLLDKKGNMQKLPDNYTFPNRRFSNGLVVTENKEHKFGFMNKKLELVIPCIFDSAERFIGKYAIVVYKGKDAVIDAKGNIYYCEDIYKE